MNNELEGNEIINLFSSHFDTEKSLEKVQKIYETAKHRISSDPVEAIKFCNEALQIIDNEPLENLANLETLYTKGKCYLLLASIYLNESEDLIQAEDYYLESYDIFASRKWLQLEALALLGLAITRRKSGQFDEANNACKQAGDCIIPELIPSQVNIDPLKKAILQEELTVKEQRAKNAQEKSEKTVPLFKISTSKEVITKGDTTDANFLSRQEYEQVSQLEQAVINVDQVEAAQYTDYILEIDDQVDQAVDGLNKGDWLFIREEENPDRLNNQRVAVLLQQQGQNQASLKIFSTKVQNLYFLETINQNTTCIAVVGFDGDFEKVSSFYKNFHRPVDVVWVHTVRMSGIVVEHIPKADIDASYILEIPILNDISAGLGIIVESDVVDYCIVKAKTRKKDNFGVKVVGSSMRNDNISDGDIALFHPQPTIKQGEIAAVVITSPEMEPLGVIKRYRVVYENRDDLRHWLLESSNPSSPHLVVMPSGVNEAVIEQMYAKSVKAGKIVQPEFYRNAKISIAGKYIGKCEDGVLDV